MTAATIPMPGDLAELIGSAAEKVENRSLLLDKFAFHKEWGLHQIKANDAHRWSLLRIAEGGDLEIARDGRRRKDDADRLARKGQNPDKVTKLRIEADLAEELSRTVKTPKDLTTLRASHTRRFLGLFRSAFGDRASVTIGQLEGRLAINLADSLIQNAGICLDRLFGLPYIPGSAVKGVCRHAALEELASAEGQERSTLLRAFVAVFGTSENDFEPAKPARKPGDKDKSAGSLFPYVDLVSPCDQKGAISFLPAYPVNPETKIVVDLTNVHFPEYYRNGRESDQRNESPRPNPFPAVEIGSQFAFCLVLNGINDDKGLLAHARRWLVQAVTVRGLGAKTAAGYGWFSIRDDILEELDAVARREAEAAQAAEALRIQAEALALAEKERLANLSPESAAAEELLKLNDEAFALFAKLIADKDEIQQRAFLSLLRDNKNKRERWKTWKNRKPEIAAGIQAAAAKLNLPSLP